MEEGTNKEANDDSSKGQSEHLDSKKKLKVASQYTVQKKEEVDKLSVRVANMGFIRRVWDAKVPQINKTFYHFFSLTPENRDDILEEIEKYQDFYEELSEAVHKAGNPADRTEEEKEEPYGKIIIALNDTLSQMYESAKSGKDTTASSSIYKLHKSFIEKHKELEDMICRVECVVLREKMRSASKEMEASNRSVDDLSVELRNAIETLHQTNETVATLMTNNLSLSNELNEFRENKTDLEARQIELQQENEEMRNRIENLLQENAEKAEENERLIIKNKDIVKEQQKLRQENEELCQEIQSLKQKNQKMVEEQEILLFKYRKVQEEVQGLLQKNREQEEEKVRMLQEYREMEEEQETLRKNNQIIMDELKILLQKDKSMTKVQDILLQDNAFLKAQLEITM